MLATLFALLGSPWVPARHETRVDCIEINHVIDKQGDVVFSQAILWRIDPADGRLHNYGWKMLRERADWPWWSHGCIVIHHVDARGVVVITAPFCRVRSSSDDMERIDTQEFWHGLAPNLFSCQAVSE